MPTIALPGFLFTIIVLAFIAIIALIIIFMATSKTKKG